MTLSTRAREQLYNAEVKKAREAKRGEFPICRLCDLPITPGQRWHINHQAENPRWLGGPIDGLSHARCNLKHAHTIDNPKFHKNNRLRQKHIGAHRSAQPMRFGRDSSIKLRMNGTPVYRDSGKPVLVRPWVKTL